MAEGKSIHNYHLADDAVDARVLAIELDTTELEYINGVTAGTATASKAAVLGATKNINTMLFDVQTVAAATAGALAGPISATAGDTVYVTGADGSKIVTLPSAVAGMRFTVINSVANQTLLVYPYTDDTINGGTATSGYVSLPAGSLAVFTARSAVDWRVTIVPQGITATAAQLNATAVTTAGTAEASKTAVLGTNKNLDVLAVADLKLGAGAGTSVTADATQLNSCDANVGTVSGTGAVAVETGFGNFKTTTITFTDTPVVLADEAGVIAYGSLKVYTCPQGYVYVQSALTNVALTKSSAGVNVDWDGDFGVGTAACGNDNDLTGTEQNLIPKTATPQAAAGATTMDGVSTATEHAIYDGTSTALPVYVNILVDDADHDVTSTPCNLILNGTLVFNWIFMGDN